jgi:hypothetical protein
LKLALCGFQFDQMPPAAEPAKPKPAEPAKAKKGTNIVVLAVVIVFW